MSDLFVADEAAAAVLGSAARAEADCRHWLGVPFADLDTRHWLPFMAEPGEHRNTASVLPDAA